MKIGLIISIYNIIVNAFYYHQTGNWTSIASSSDGIKLIACNNQTDKTIVGGVFISNDAGLSWNYTTIPNGQFVDVASDYSGRNLYVVWGYQIDQYNYNGRIYSSHDFGLSWTYIDMYGTLIETDSSGKYIYLACFTKLCVSEDYGSTFKDFQVYDGQQNYAITSLACDSTGKKVFAVINGNFLLYKSNNYGQNWELVELNYIYTEVVDVAVDSSGNNIIINVIETAQDSYSTKRNLIYSSNNGGLSWVTLSTEINSIDKITLDVNGSYLSVTQALYDISNVYFSSDYGLSWVSLFQPTPTTLAPTLYPTPIPKTPTLKPTSTPTRQPTKNPYPKVFTTFYCAIYTNLNAVVGSSYGTLFRADSVNNQIWSNVAPGIFISSVISSRNFIYASIFKANSNILLYNLNESRWLADNNQTNGIYISSLASNYQNDIILASGFYDDYIYISYDNSTSWYALKNSTKSDWISVDCDMSCINILAYDNKSSLYFSNDTGQTWQRLSTPLSGSVMTTFALNRYDPYHILAAGYNTGIFYSLDLGSSWVDSSFIQRLWANVTLDNSGQYSLAINYYDYRQNPNSSGIYFSHDFGRTWNQPASSPKLLDMETWTKITSDASGQFGAAIYATTYYAYSTYIYYSTDYGMNWAQISYPGNWKNIFMSDSPIIIATEYSSSYRSNLFYKIELGFGNNNYSISILSNLNNYSSSSVVDIVGNSDLTLLIIIMGKSIYYFDAKSYTWSASDAVTYTYTKLSIDRSGAYCVAAAVSSTILLSKDYGRSFNPTNSSIGDWFMVSTDSTFSTIIGLQYLKKSVFYSYDLGSSWIEVPEAIDYRAFAIARLNSSIMLAAGGSSSYEYKTSPIYVSYNGGSSWQTGSPISKQWKSIATSESGEMVFVAGINSSLFRSVDGGSLWTNSSSPEACSWIYVACSRLGEYAIALSLNCGVYGSIDYGKTWHIQDSIPKGLWSSATFDPSGANIAYITSSSNLDSIQVVSINVPPNPSPDSSGSDESNKLDTSVIIIISVVVPVGSALFILVSRYLYKNDKKKLVFLYLTLSAMGDLLSDILFLISISTRSDLETRYLRTVNDALFYLGVTFLSFVALFNMYCIYAYGEFRYTIFQPEPGFLEEQYLYITQEINKQSDTSDKQGNKDLLGNTNLSSDLIEKKQSNGYQKVNSSWLIKFGCTESLEEFERVSFRYWTTCKLENGEKQTDADIWLKSCGFFMFPIIFICTRATIILVKYILPLILTPILFAVGIVWFCLYLLFTNKFALNVLRFLIVILLAIKNTFLAFIELIFIILALTNGELLYDFYGIQRPEDITEKDKKVESDQANTNKKTTNKDQLERQKKSYLHMTIYGGLLEDIPQMLIQLIYVFIVNIRNDEQLKDIQIVSFVLSGWRMISSIIYKYCMMFINNEEGIPPQPNTMRFMKNAINPQNMENFGIA